MKYFIHNAYLMKMLPLFAFLFPLTSSLTNAKLCSFVAHRPFMDTDFCGHCWQSWGLCSSCPLRPAEQEEMRVIFNTMFLSSSEQSFCTNCAWWSGAARGPRRDPGQEEFQHCALHCGNQQARVWLASANSEHKQTSSKDAPPPTRYHASTLYFPWILSLSFALYPGICFHCCSIFIQGNSLWHGSTEMPKPENSIPIMSCLFSMNSKTLGLGGGLLA